MVFGTKQARAKAKKHHKERSKRARAADEGKQAKRVLAATFKNIEKWMKNSGRYDIKLIDTKEEKETKEKHGELRPI